MGTRMDDIDALRKLLSYARQEAEEIGNIKLVILLENAIREIDLYDVQWEEESESSPERNKRENP